MKPSILAAVLFLLPATLSFTSAAEQNYSLPLSKPGEATSLIAEVHTGTVSVSGYDGETIEITARVKDVDPEDMEKVKRSKPPRQAGPEKKAPSTEGLKAVKSRMMKLEIEEEDNEVYITSQYSTQHVVLDIKVPRRADLGIEVYKGGNISISNISGSIEASAYQGGITANKVSGPIVAETYNTDIVVNFDSFNKENPTSLTSHKGNIDITLNKQVAAKVNVQSYQGEIYSGLDSEFVAIENVERSNENGKQSIEIASVMSTKVNGGGQDITLTTYSGNVYIRK